MKIRIAPLIIVAVFAAAAGWPGWSHQLPWCLPIPVDRYAERLIASAA
jgi:hypothetical protein